MADNPKCELCGEPMPPGEEMFKIHGYSGNCPKPPLPRSEKSTTKELLEACKTALKALRSYQYGNSSPDLAEEVADAIEEVITRAERE